MTTSRHLGWLGLVGLLIGLLMAAVATLIGGDLAGLLRGYGLMLAASAGYLLAGLRLLAWRRRITSAPADLRLRTGQRRLGRRAGAAPRSR